MLSAALAQDATVTGVARPIDGDTFEIGAAMIRLHGIDAPETGQSCARSDGTPWARDAAALDLLTDLLGTHVVACEILETDHYGRPIELEILYQGGKDAEARPRPVEPHGLLLGTRRYLVARPAGGDGRMRRFRLDRIAAAEIAENSFARDPEFNLATHAAQGFGSYYADHEFGPVVWRFAPEAAETARGFVFHPNQTVTEEADGALTVRFAASGHLKWHGTSIAGATPTRCWNPLPCEIWWPTTADRISPRCHDPVNFRHRQGVRISQRFDERPAHAS